MTEFELRRTEKLIVHELVQMNLNQFTTTLLANQRSTAVWSEGILIFMVPLPNTDAIIESFRDGKEEHLMTVLWCKYDDYQNEITGIGGMKIGVIEAGSHLVSELAKWIKEDPNGN